MGDKFEMAEVRKLARRSKPNLAGAVVRSRATIKSLQSRLAHCEWSLYQARKHFSRLGIAFACVVLLEVLAGVGYYFGIFS